jgi:molybdopterin molybdotransferase
MAPLRVEEALRIVLDAAFPLPPEERPLAEVLGAVLAEDVAADADHPPFDRALMDGYAVRAADAGPLEVLEEIPAGRMPREALRPGTCSKIMTGAPLPAGADAVQQVEKTRVDGGRAILAEPVRPGQNVSPRGEEARAGQVMLRRGQRLRAAELGILASMGRAAVRTTRRPRVAIAATGDELVPAGERPGPGRIRNSNAWTLGGQVRSMGLVCDDLGIVRDDPAALRAAVKEGLARDVLILTGGVSAGDWDLVIPALEAEGVKISMHKVAIKPGRPFCFAPRVFGLPGNPVSAFVTFEVFVRPYLGALMGAGAPPPRLKARLVGDVPKAIDREHYLPAKLSEGPTATRVPWKGSADLFALAAADAFVVIPPGRTAATGDLVEVLPF